MDRYNVIITFDLHDTKDYKTADDILWTMKFYNCIKEDVFPSTTYISEFKISDNENLKSLYKKIKDKFEEKGLRINKFLIGCISDFSYVDNHLEED